MQSKDLHSPAQHLVHFRFYQELNDFLPAPRRQIHFGYRFIGKPTIKDLVEAMGVPHVEVDLVLVNGNSVNFDFKPRHGDQISVYPMFEALDIQPITRLRAKPLSQSRFIIDVNLGKLARYLRLLGFDCLYSNQYEDKQIVLLAKKHKRIILTRDIGLLKHKLVSHGYWVRKTNPRDQLKEVVGRLQLENGIKPYSRCSSCNGLLSHVNKDSLGQKVPAGTLSNFNHFWQCETCQKIYWKGSHFLRINGLIRDIKTSVTI